MFKLILTGALVGMLLGCDGGTDQDPLRGQPPEIRNAELKEKVDEKVENRRRQQRDSMVISMSPESVVFVEGEENRFFLKGRLINELKTLEPTLKLDNLENIPGSLDFDAETGQFSWTPPLDFVVGSEMFKVQPLRVQLRAKCGEKNFCVREQVYNIVVLRASLARRPRVVSITQPKDVFEGQDTTFEVVVEDISSSAVSPPTLNIIPTTKSYTAVPAIDIPAQALGKPNPSKVIGQRGQWKFRVNLEGGNLQLTSDTAFSYSVYARTAEGQLSARPEIAKWTYKNRVETPIFSTPDPPVFEVGKKTVYEFFVHRPGNHGELEVKFDSSANSGCSQLRGTHDCSCKEYTKQYDLWSYICRIEWTPNLSAASSNVYIRIEAESKDSSDTSDKRKSTDYMNFKVGPPPQRIPSPAPVNPQPVTPNPSNPGAPGPVNPGIPAGLPADTPGGAR